MSDSTGYLEESFDLYAKDLELKAPFLLAASLETPDTFDNFHILETLPFESVTIITEFLFFLIGCSFSKILQRLFCLCLK